MKVGIFAVIPSEVRYDRHLSDKSKLLYAEIAAAANTYGVTEENNGYYATVLNVDKRTITRCIAQLVDNGHLITLVENGKRKLKIMLKGLPVPETAAVVKAIESESVAQDVDRVLSFWEERRKYSIPAADREAYGAILKKRFHSFTAQEIIKAIQARCSYMNTVEWYSLPENADSANDLRSIITDDETLLGWLQSDLNNDKTNSI